MSVVANYGQIMPLITPPTRPDYTFGGYYSQPNGGGTQYYTSSGDSARTWDSTTVTTLYAKWTKDSSGGTAGGSSGGSVGGGNGSSGGTTGGGAAAGTGQTLPAYKIAFNSNATGVTGKMVAQKIAYGKAAKLKANKFKAPKGKKFAGWATSAANAKKGKAKYKNKAKVKNLLANGKTVKLYAAWKKK